MSSRKPTEKTIKRDMYVIVDVTSASFCASGPEGQQDRFTIEEVHPKERSLVSVGAEFTLHHLYRTEIGNKTKIQRIEFDSSLFGDSK